MADEVTRQECKDGMERIHQRVDEIKESSIRMEESTKRIEKFAEDMHKAVYGNGNDCGIVVRITKLFERVGLQSKLLFLIIPSIIGLAFYVLQNLLIK